MQASRRQVIRTMCPMSCHPTLCGMLAEVEDGRLLKISGDHDNLTARAFSACVGGPPVRSSTTPSGCCGH
jgi:hypothetical protein